MSVTDKIDKILNEGNLPSQGKVLSTISKGLGDVSDITSSVGMGLWHYIANSHNGYIMKSQNSNKIMDELWHRTAGNIEKSERLTDDGLKKLKKNFYSLTKTLMNIYSWDNKSNRWEGYGYTK